MLALLCFMVCTACPALAESASSGVGRDQVLSDHISTAETAQSGDDLKDAFNDYGGKLPGIIDEVKQGWEDVFSGISGVLSFLSDTIGGIIAVMPASYRFDTLTVTIVAMDELSVQMNSRSFKENFNAYFLNTLLTCRHSYISIYGSAQRFQHVDKLMRDVTHTVIQCQKVWRFQLWSSYDAWEMENATNAEMIRPLRRGLWYVHDRDYAAYDTLAIVNNLKKKFEDGDILTEEEIINNQAPAGPLGLEVTTNPTQKAKRRMQSAKK